MPYWVKADLEARLSVATVRRIYDDDNDGTADTNPITRLQEDSDSKVNGYLRGIYPLPITPVPNELKRLSLDVAVAMAGQRHPEFIRRDWKKEMEAAEQELRDIRTGKTRLDVQGAPEPAANQGGQLISQDDSENDEPVKWFIGGMGDW